MVSLSLLLLPHALVDQGSPSNVWWTVGRFWIQVSDHDRMPTLITHRYPSCGRCCGLRLAIGWVCMCYRMSHCGLELHAWVGVPPTISIPFWFSLEFQLTLLVAVRTSSLNPPSLPQEIYEDSVDSLGGGGGGGFLLKAAFVFCIVKMWSHHDIMGTISQWVLHAQWLENHTTTCSADCIINM